MKAVLVILFLALSVMFVYGQPNPKHQLPVPKNPKGVTATQDKAMPYYVEALHYLENDNDSAAIHNLHRAIGISNALVEAHLLLADVYLKNGDERMAMKYYNSGIDFAIEQDTSYYHKLFDLCLRHGEYDVLKHNLKHYKKLYPSGPAEYYYKSVDMVYSVSNWKKQYTESLLDSTINGIEDLIIVGNSIWIKQNGKLYTYKYRRSKLKKAKLVKSKLNLSGVDAITLNEKGEVFMHQSGENQIICMSIKGRRKLRETGKIAMSHTNLSGMCAVKENQLIVSSAVNGSNFSLYNLTAKGGESETLEAPYFDNGNEMHPSYVDGSFYYSTNGEASFGNEDIYVCEGYEILKGAWLPNNPKNARAQVNGFTKDKKLVKAPDGSLIVWKVDNNGKHYLMRLSPNPIQTKEMLWETFE